VLPAGKATVRFEFVYDGGIGKGGVGTILVNGKSVATGRIEKTQPAMFSADEGADVGADEGTAVTAAYEIPFKFTGKIKRVTIELGSMSSAEAIEAEKVRREAAIKAALSN
jgi:arylsulfatase